jgi:hypothetical protein
MGSEFWKTHVLRAQEFSGSEQDYCDRNNLTKSTFARYKNQMGLSRSKKVAESAFVKVEAPEKAKPEKRPEAVKLPEAMWLAKFLQALMEKQ